MFKLSKKSYDKLVGVDQRLVDVVTLAIKLTSVDFVVTEGLRSVERQRQLVAKGASQTMKSKHIEGKAVDLAAYVGDRISWEMSLYDDIADAMKAAAQELGVGIRWGGAWHIDDIREWEGSMQDAMDDYIRLRQSQGKRPFLDGPHHELS